MLCCTYSVFSFYVWQDTYGRNVDKVQLNVHNVQHENLIL